VKKEIKTRISNTVLFLFKVISAYLNAFVASFKKCLETVSKGLQRNSVQFGRQVFLNVFNMLKPPSFEGGFQRRIEKNIRWCEIRRIGWLAYLHSTVFGQKFLHYQCGTGRGIVVQQQPTDLCSKLFPHPVNAPQQSSDNFNIESTIDCLLFRHKFFMNHTLIAKRCDQHGLDLGILQMKHFWPLRSIAFSDVSSLGHIKYP
jgi:hypothetical protein